jgi:ABC-type multidrug transport system fused ATPase/permease subunit
VLSGVYGDRKNRLGDGGRARHMRATEQIDALYSMAINPVKYLVSPRIIASLIAMPLLTAIFDVVGIFGAYLIGVGLLGVSSGSYFAGMENSVVFQDVYSGFVKSLSFGLIITWVCCYKASTRLRWRPASAAPRPNPSCFRLSSCWCGTISSPRSCCDMIRVVDLHKSFGKQQVLKGVNLEFVTGKITTIVGTSGCGKTVLMKHLNALLLPDSGQVLIDGYDITKLKQRELYEDAQPFGVLFQGAALLDSMTIFRQCGVPAAREDRSRRSHH